MADSDDKKWPGSCASCHGTASCVLPGGPSSPHHHSLDALQSSVSEVTMITVCVHVHVIKITHVIFRIKDTNTVDNLKRAGKR